MSTLLAARRAAPRLMRGRSPAAVLALLCIVAGTISAWEGVRESLTIDEPVYITAGLTTLTRHDARLNPQHPPLSKVVAALPVLAAHPILPYGHYWRTHGGRLYSQVFDNLNRQAGKLREITLLARIVPVLELMLSGVLVYAIARRLAGPPGGIFAAAMWLLNPFVIGMGHYDGIDLPFAVATLLSVLALVRWLEVRTTSRLVQLGAACAVAVLVRYTGPIVLAVAVLTVAVASRRLRPPLVVGAAAIGLMWLFYAAFDPAYTFAHANLLPQRYVDGVHALAAAHQGPQPVFLLGHQWYGTRWWFWPVNAAIKLPVTLLAAYALAVWAARRVEPGARRRVYLAVLPTALALIAFTVIAPDDRGLRYMFGAIALLTVCVAPVARARRYLPALLVAGSMAFLVQSLPDSFAWTAPPFRPGYAMAADANLDWGQDAGDLARWGRGKHPWVGCYSPRGSGCVNRVPGARRLTRFTPPRKVSGWVAISATLRNQERWQPWLWHQKLAGTIDGTILLYDVPPHHPA